MNVKTSLWEILALWGVVEGECEDDKKRGRKMSKVDPSRLHPLRDPQKPLPFWPMLLRSANEFLSHKVWYLFSDGCFCALWLFLR